MGSGCGAGDIIENHYSYLKTVSEIFTACYRGPNRRVLSASLDEQVVDSLRAHCSSISEFKN